MINESFKRRLFWIGQSKIVRGTSAFVAVIVLWEFLSSLRLYNTLLFPGPRRIAMAFSDMFVSGEWFGDLRDSGVRYSLGFVLGSVIGVGLGTLTGRIPVLRDTLGVLLNYMRSTPSVALIPLVIVWFGIGEEAKVFVVAWGVTFPVWVNTHSGIAEVEKEYVWAARSLGAEGSDLYWEVYLPRAVPFVIAGTRIAIATGFFSLAAAEMAGAFGGVAFRIFHSHQMFRTDKMMVGILTIGALGVLCDRLFVSLTGWLLPWWRGESQLDK